MPTIKDWNERDVTVVRSRGGVMVLTGYADNIIRNRTEPWPPPALVQKLYESRPGNRAFYGAARRQVRRTLGVYSDIQSIHSEDAISWSFFGPLVTAPKGTRVQFLNWLMERLGLPWVSNHSYPIAESSIPFA